MGFPALYTVRQDSDDSLRTILIVEDRGKWKMYMRFGDIFRVQDSADYGENVQNEFNDPRKVPALIGIPWYGEETYTFEGKEDVSDALIKETLSGIKIEKA